MPAARTLPVVYNRAVYPNTSTESAPVPPEVEPVTTPLREFGLTAAPWTRRRQPVLPHPMP